MVVGAQPMDPANGALTANFLAHAKSARELHAGCVSEKSNHTLALGRI